MAGNETTINARITLDTTAMQRVPAAFNPATAAANQFGQAAQRAGVAMDTLGAKAQKAMRMASKVRGIAGQIGYAASALGLEGTAGATVGGAVSGGTTGAFVGAGLGTVIPGVGTAIGGVIGGAVGGVLGGVRGYMGGSAQEEAAKTAATEENTRALAELIGKLDEVMLAQTRAADNPQALATLGRIIGDLKEQIEQRRVAGADEERARAMLAAEAFSDVADKLVSEYSKSADKMIQVNASRLAEVAQNVEILKTHNRYLGGGSH